MSFVRLRRLALICALVVGSGACTSTDAGTPTETWSSQQVLAALSTWVDQTGLVQDDQSTWRTRLSEICDGGVWDEAVAMTLASEYVAEDEARYSGLEGETPGVRLAAESLWMVAADTCPERFPGGEPGERGW